jgi:very-short-patch-repair endonuclease
MGMNLKPSVKFELLCKAHGLEPTPEWRFCERRWRFDFAFVDQRVAVEIDGAVWARGRHQRPKGFISDCDKLNTAQMNGWVVLRFTDEHMKDGDKCIRLVKEALAQRRGM